ncbi:MAG: phosphate ABC transporter substrate-binding protein PstS [Streptosporangiaceae bacterium]|nr:phosphate ABC transporter substrate-binding protein PstS [Streptosporangiaceae bacterium]MBV9858250.1 phosphate ABC transporter substrate-binding protein PstS [Streptosporangiaceae bacterium]
MQLRRSKQVTAVGGAVVALALSVAACSSSSSSSPPSSGGSGSTSGSGSGSGTLNGAGSTFQLTFQQAAISSFKSVDPGITVNYNGSGSGAGRTALASGTVNFAGSDSTIPPTEQSSFKGTVLYFPVLIGPITMSYNLPGVTSLKLTPAVIAAIFQGKIKAWNDPAIKSVNPGVSLPSTAITLAVRSDSSGTTQNFSLFLEKAAGSAWTLGSSSIIKWPSTAHAASGNGGVAQVIKSTPGAIGYVDYSTAKASSLTFASVKNKSGAYVAPSPTSASAAAGAVTVKPDLTFHAVWASGANAYPITYQTWDLVYEKQPNANAAKLLQSYLGYLLGDGQQLLTQLNYAPLPASLDSMAKAQLSKITS